MKAFDIHVELIQTLKKDSYGQYLFRYTKKRNCKMMKTILVTGWTSFISSNFVTYFLGKYEDFAIYKLAKN